MTYTIFELFGFFPCPSGMFGLNSLQIKIIDLSFLTRGSEYTAIWVRFKNATNLEHYKISFSTFWLTDIKKFWPSPICSQIWQLGSEYNSYILSHSRLLDDIVNLQPVYFSKSGWTISIKYDKNTLRHYIERQLILTYHIKRIFIILNTWIKILLYNE